MGGSSIFQTVLITGFIVIALIAVAIFALGGFGGGGGTITSRLQPVEIWGTYPSSVMANIIGKANQARGNLPTISYREIDSRNYDNAVTEALSTGGGPDLFFVNETIIRYHQKKITTIFYSTFPERTYKDRFAEGTEVYLFPSAIYAMPFAIDPLIMYWNRDLVSAANFTAPPQYWDQMYDYVKAITKRSADGLDVTRATVALGDFRNVDHSTEILSTLFFQSGEKITMLQGKDLMKSQLGAQNQNATQAALRFYTEFTNPTSQAYTWNRALPKSRDAFLGNTLAIYFGFASEYRFIREANPNLNFDVAPMPQKRDTVRPVTYGTMIGLAISRMSDNKSGAYAVANALSDPDLNVLFTDSLGLAPVRRDVLAKTESDPWKSVTYRSAINAKAWYQPSSYWADSVFQTMIESVISGKMDVPRALQQASQDLAAFFD